MRLLLKLVALPFKVVAVVFILCAAMIDGKWSDSLAEYWDDEFWS